MVVLGALLALLVGACDRGDSGPDARPSPSDTDAPQVAAGDPAGYCELARTLESAREAAAGGAGEQDQWEAALAFQQFAKAHLEVVREMATVAPGPVRHDVGTLASALERAAGGDSTGVAESRFLSAAVRVTRYEERECGIRRDSETDRSREVLWP